MKVKLVAEITVTTTVSYDASSTFNVTASGKKLSCTILPQDVDKQEAFLTELDALIRKYDEEIPF